MPRKRKTEDKFDPTVGKPKLRIRVMSEGKELMEGTGIGEVRQFCKKLSVPYTTLAEKPNGEWRAINV
jgi:hypothetical protein